MFRKIAAWTVAVLMVWFSRDIAAVQYYDAIDAGFNIYASFAWGMVHFILWMFLMSYLFYKIRGD